MSLHSEDSGMEGSQSSGNEQTTDREEGNEQVEEQASHDTEQQVDSRDHEMEGGEGGGEEGEGEGEGERGRDLEEQAGMQSDSDSV